MSANDISGGVVRLPYDTAKHLLEECQKKFLLPSQIIAMGLGEDLREPAIIKFLSGYAYVYPPSEFLKPDSLVLRPRGQEKSLYLQILSQMINGASKDEFVEHVKTLRGSKRVYFGRSREEVEGTGSNNEAALIPDTGWFASVNNSGDKKQQILTTLMRRLGFSADYVWLISHVPCFRQLRLRGISFKTA